MSEIVIQFSRAAPVEWFDRRIKDRSLCICRLTHSPFSHVDFVLGDETDKRFPAGSLLGASDNPHAPVILGNARGVAVRPYDYQQFSIRKIARIQCTDEERAAFIKFCLDQLGKPFDTGALKLSTFLSPDWSNRDWRNPIAWYCAELMARATEVACVIKHPIIAVKNRITAADYLLVVSHIMINRDTFWSKDEVTMGEAGVLKWTK